MTASQPSDWLLKVANLLLLIVQGFLALAAAALVVGLPTIIIIRDRAEASLRAEMGDPNLVFPLVAIVAVLMLAMVIVGMAFYFFGRMRQIVLTVEEGDPFVPENAERLTLMAWLMLGMQALALPAAGLAVFIASRLGEDAGNVDASFDLSGIILVITLFILARVFRKGTEMRDDLEGTV